MSWKRPPREEDGLMPQIMALLAPPSEFHGPKPEENNLHNPHQYYKVPGKGHNRDLCDACGEGGDIICCDRCPASFHLLCHEPPLREDELPQEWVCKACQVKMIKINMKNETVKKRGRPSSKAEANKTDNDSAVSKVKRGKPLVNGNSSTDLVSVATEMEDDFKLSPEFLMESFRENQQSSNPKAFKLNKNEIALPGTPFPGESRRDTKRQFEVCESGVVQKPFKVCFTCRKTCRNAALLSCDFCSLYYHLDCLNPPLAHIPTGMWMCPNHPHQFVEEKRLVSCRLSERLKYWDLLSQPLDQDEVQLNFLRTGSRKFPPFRQKVRLLGKERISVPSAVKCLYEKRCTNARKLFDEDTLKGAFTKQEEPQFERPAMEANESLSTAGGSYTPVYPSVYAVDKEAASSSRPQGGKPLLRQADAFIVPVNSRMPSLPVNKTSIKVGTGVSSDLYLPHYGTCRYVSELQCVIFYDKVENSYELLNYSCFGSVVDGTNYVVENGVKRENEVTNEVQCKCGKTVQKGIESSAVLLHGSVLNFGCIPFVFSLPSECAKS